MNFSQSELTSQVADSAREFALQHIKPHFMQWDETQHFPIQVFKEMGKMGFMGVLVPEDYGGAGLGYFEYSNVIQQIAKVCGSIGLSLAAHNSLCTGHILSFGNEAQKKKYLTKLATCEYLGAWGLTEPNTGSDAGNMKTTAVKQGDNWVINGTKNFITHGISGDVAVVICRTGEPRAKDNSTAFIVERGTPGFSGGKKEDKLGMRASETAEMIFDQCIIPDANRLGEVGAGFKQAMKVLDGGRISIAALALGIAKGAYEASVKYSKERQQFDKPIAQYQAISFKLADMAMKIELARNLLYKACWLKDNHLPFAKEAAMSKLYCSEIAREVADEGVQIHGGYGLMKDYDIERFYRDQRLLQIGEGTSEIQRMVISRYIGC